MKRIALVVIFLMSSTAGAQARPFVAPDDRVYRDIARLTALGLIDTVLVGARPYSEREVARLLAEARRNLDRNPAARPWAERVIRADSSRLARAGNRAVDAVELEGTHMYSAYRPILSDPNGRVDAAINPLAANRGGRPLADGTTANVQTFHSATLGSNVALSLNPLFTVQEPRNGQRRTLDARLHTGSVSVLFGNLSIVAGRDYAIFGQALEGGLMLSENAPPLDMIRVGNDRPFVLPWWLRLAGPLRGELLVADLGAHRQIHPHSKLIAYHIAAMPHPQLEIGLEILDAMGGTGGEPATLGDRVLDALAFVDVFRSNGDFQFSNKMAGGDFHWRVPTWRGFELYGETVVDDFDARRLRSVFLEDGGYVVGTALSCLLECGRVGVRAEYRQTGIRFYTHNDYPIGENGALLGDPLGPRGLGGYLTVDGESNGGDYRALTGAFEVRSGNGYVAVATPPSDNDFHFVQVSRAPAEKRARLLATTTATPLHGSVASLRFTGGVERVTNFGFVAGSNRINWIAGLAVVVHP